MVYLKNNFYTHFLQTQFLFRRSQTTPIGCKQTMAFSMDTKKRHIPCGDCGKLMVEGKSKICPTCFQDRPTCKGCPKKVAKMQDGGYFTYCKTCSCTKAGCLRPHKKDYAYCGDCIAQYTKTCQRCGVKPSRMFQSTCDDCKDPRCQDCNAVMRWDSKASYCVACSCKVWECGALRMTGQEFCASCAQTRKCQTPSCQSLRIVSTKMDSPFCSRCRESTLPKCAGVYCANTTGPIKDEPGKYYKCCRSCVCTNVGCQEPRDSHLYCEKCNLLPKCEAPGCQTIVQRKGFIYCNLCLSQYDRGYIKCSMAGCPRYILEKYGHPLCTSCFQSSKPKTGV